jgi:phosphate transport system protein
MELNPRNARRICRVGDDVERACAEITDDLTSEMRRSPDHLEPALCYCSCTRYLQRIAAHAINIAEDVIYLVEGEIVRHRPEKLRNMVNQLAVGT